MKKFFNNKGMSIAEVMIAGSIGIAMMGAMVQMNLSTGKSIKSMESKLEENIFLAEISQILSNPTTCTKSIGDYCKDYEGDIINPSACKGTGFEWVENGIDLNEKWVPVATASRELDLQNAGGTATTSLRAWLLPRLMTAQTSATVPTLWLSRSRKIENTCKTEEAAAGSAFNTKKANYLKDLFVMGAKFVFGSISDGVKAQVRVSAPNLGGGSAASAVSQAARSTTVEAATADARENINAAVSPTGATTANPAVNGSGLTNSNLGATGVSGTAFAATALNASMLSTMVSAIDLSRFELSTDFRNSLNVSSAIGSIREALRGGNTAANLAEQQLGEECKRKWNGSDNIIIKDIRVSMDGDDPLPNLRSVKFDAFQYYQEFKNNTTPVLVQPSNPSAGTTTMSMFDALKNGRLLGTSGMYLNQEMVSTMLESMTCRNPYSELDGQFPTQNLIKTKHAYDSSGKIVKFNKIRPKNIVVVVKYYMPNYLGGIHRSRSFNITALPLMLDDPNDTTTVRVAKCGMFYDSYESTVFDGCTNQPPPQPVVSDFTLSLAQSPSTLFAFDPSLGEIAYNTQRIRDLFPPDILTSIAGGIPMNNFMGENVTIDPMPAHHQNHFNQMINQSSSIPGF